MAFLLLFFESREDFVSQLAFDQNGVVCLPYCSDHSQDLRTDSRRLGINPNVPAKLPMGESPFAFKPCSSHFDRLNSAFCLPLLIMIW